MPLLPTKLATEIENNVLNKTSSGGSVTSQDWANALGNYFIQGVNPPTIAASLAGAKSAFVGALPPLGATPGLEAANLLTFKGAFLQFGLVILAGYPANPAGVVSTPPIGPGPIFESTFGVAMSSPPIPTIALAQANVIHTFFITGTANALPWS